MVKINEFLVEARDAISVRRVFGEPFEKNGVTVIPVARIMGGAGGGEGNAPAADGEAGSEAGGVATGSGGGFGLAGQPAGVFVVRGEEVRWLPAVDVNRLMFGFQLVMIVFFLVVRSIANGRARATKAMAQETHTH